MVSKIGKVGLGVYSGLQKLFEIVGNGVAKMEKRAWPVTRRKNYLKSLGSKIGKAGLATYWGL